MMLIAVLRYGEILQYATLTSHATYHWFFLRCVSIHCTVHDGFYVMFLITQPDEWRLVLFNYTKTCRSAGCDGNAMRLYQLLLHFVLAGKIIARPFIRVVPVLFDTLRMSSICCNTCTDLYSIFYILYTCGTLLRVRLL